MKIRPATPADADALKRVVEAAYAPFVDAGLDLPPVAEGLAEDIRDHLVFVAEDEAIIGGIVAVRKDQGIAIANLAVDPKVSGAGIGRTLLQTIERVAMTEGIGTLTLTSHSEMARTLAFYERLGWQKTGQDGARVFLAKSVS